MELEKLKEIIADVLNVEVNDITEDTTFEIDNDDAEQISTVGDAVEQIKNATNNN